MKPQIPPARRGAVSFTRVMDQALGELVRYKQTYTHAFDIGIRPKELISYAQGELEGHERRAFESLLAQSPWATSRVVAIVKARRTGPLGLTLPHNDDLSGLKLLDTV
jgi:hypothetical protein